MYMCVDILSCTNFKAYLLFIGTNMYMYDDTGSVFIETLVDIFSEEACKHDVVTLMTKVSIGA